MRTVFLQCLFGRGGGAAIDDHSAHIMYFNSQSCMVLVSDICQQWMIDEPARRQIAGTRRCSRHQARVGGLTLVSPMLLMVMRVLMTQWQSGMTARRRLAYRPLKLERLTMAAAAEGNTTNTTRMCARRSSHPCRARADSDSVGNSQSRVVVCCVWLVLSVNVIELSSLADPVRSR